MPSGRTSRRSINTAWQSSLEGTQRERLLAGMVASAGDAGYAGASVSEVIAQAGVSRPTFYDYFSDRDNCFVAAVIDVQERVLGDVERAVRSHAPKDAATAAVAALVEFAIAEPLMTRFVTKEALAGGAAALKARDRGIAQVARIVERALARAPAATATPDLPLEIAIGAVYRLLASRLRRGERALGAMLEDLRDWTASYGQAAGELRWRALAPGPTVALSPFVSATPFHFPPPLAPGRPLLTEEDVAENHRQRIMFATAQVIHKHGYGAAKIADITKLASLDTRAFYRLFASKQEAFDAIYEVGFQHLIKTCADAFFAGTTWPDRMWEALRAGTQTVQSDPAAAYVGFVAAYAVGPGEIQRVEDSRTAFTVFLQEGHRYGRRRDPPSPVALEAIVASVFEIVYRQAHRSSKPETARLLPTVAQLCLTPFLGSKQTNTFIDRKLSAIAL